MHSGHGARNGSNKDISQKIGFENLLRIGAGVFLNRDSLGYYKSGQVNLLLIRAGHFNTNHGKFITNWGRNYQSGQLVQITAELGPLDLRFTPATLLKRDSDTGTFQIILRNFSGHFL